MGRGGGRTGRHPAPGETRVDGREVADVVPSGTPRQRMSSGAAAVHRQPRPRWKTEDVWAGGQRGGASARGASRPLQAYG